MQKARQPISFVATLQPEKAKAFYGDILGLKLLDSSPYALVFADGCNMLRVQIVADLSLASHTVHGWQVEDLDNEVKDLGSKGVVFLTFDHIGQDATGVWTTPDRHKIAWFKDPDGNTLSLTQFYRN